MVNYTIGLPTKYCSFQMVPGTVPVIHGAGKLGMKLIISASMIIVGMITTLLMWEKWKKKQIKKKMIYIYKV